MSANYVPLALDAYDGAGNQIVRGRATLTPSVLLVDVPDRMWIPPAPVTAVFGAYGAPTAHLRATDDTGPQPQGWQWAITFTGVPGDPAGFSFYLPYGGGATQYLSGLAPVPGSQPITITNLDGGSALSGEFPVGLVDGGGA